MNNRCVNASIYLSYQVAVVTGVPRLDVRSICLNQILCFSMCVNVKNLEMPWSIAMFLRMESDVIVPQNVPK